MLLAGGVSAQDPAFQPLLFVHESDRSIPGLLARIAGIGFSGINVGGGEDPAFALAAGLSFFVDPALPHGILHIPRRTFDGALERATRIPPILERPVGLSDPATKRRTRSLLERRLAPFKAHPPLFVSLGDEISYTRLINPIDWCHRPTTLSHFPAFVRAFFGGEEEALRTLGVSDLRSLHPMLTDTARKRFFRVHPDPRALVPWNVARAFSDERFADFLAHAALQAREILPGTPVGFLGGQMPSAFGGFDWQALLQRVDVVEPYGHGATPALVRSLSRSSTRRFRTILLEQRNIQSVIQEIDHAFLRGAAGVIVFSSRELLPGGTLAPRLSLLSPHLRLLSSPGARRFREGRPLEPQVAILHSMPSVRLHWMLDSEPDGKAWIHRSTSYEITRSTQARTRQAWVSLMEDLGLTYRFVTPADLGAGVLAGKDGPRALVLPRSIALGDASVQAIKAFVRAGGLLVADAQVGLFTERLERRPVPALDVLFGIRSSGRRPNLEGDRIRPLPVTDIPYPLAVTELEFTSAQPLVRDAFGPAMLLRLHDSLRNVPGAPRGRTLFMNTFIMDYPRDRLLRPARARWLRELLRPRFLNAGIRPRVRIVRGEGAPPWPVVCHLRRTSEGLILAVQMNLVTGGVAPPWSEVLATPGLPLEVLLPRSFRVRDLLSGRDLGRLSRIPCRLLPDSPAFFELISG